MMLEAAQQCTLLFSHLSYLILTNTLWWHFKTEKRFKKKWKEKTKKVSMCLTSIKWPNRNSASTLTRVLSIRRLWSTASTRISSTSNAVHKCQISMKWTMKTKIQIKGTTTIPDCTLSSKASKTFPNKKVIIIIFIISYRYMCVS